MQRKPLRRPELPWDEVRLFLALCRAPTLGHAALSLGVDASTVSRRLVALERALAATLFERGRDGVARTKAADDLLPVAEEMEAVMARFAAAADGLEREVSGLVRITCPPDAAEVAVAPFLPELLARHRGLRVEIDAAEQVRDLSRREADLALRPVRPEDGDLVVTRLRSVRWILVASPRLAREIGTLKAWNDAVWVGWGERMAGATAARWLTAHARTLDPLVRSNNTSVQLSLVAAGLGIALLPEPSAARHGLVPVKLGPALRESAGAWPVDELFLVAPRVLRDVPRVRVLWDHLVMRVRDRPASTVPSTLETRRNRMRYR